MKKTFLILAALLCGCFALKAQDFTYEGLNYRVTGTNPHTVELTGPVVGFTAHDFVIPSSVDYGGTSYSVTSIGNYAFADFLGLTGSLTIPNSVTNIGDCAFRQCTNLTGSLIIPNSVTNIGYWAFARSTGFTGSLTIPNSVTSIGYEAFWDCTGFDGTLTIPNSVTSIGVNAFRDCSGFTGSLTIPNSVTSIEFGVFANCSGFSGSLTIGSSMTRISERAFFNTAFTHIIAKPTTPPDLGTNAFSNIPRLSSITVPCDKVDAYKNKAGWSDYADKITGGSFQYDLTVTSANTNLGSAIITEYQGCTSHSSTVAATPAANHIFTNWTENGVVVSTANPYTFTLERDCNLVANFGRQYDFSATCSTGQTLYYRIIDAQQHWVSIVAPNSDDFNECYTGYDKPTGPITLPETVTHDETNYTVTEIGNYAFFRCDGLTGSLAIPNSVTRIGKHAFGCCSGFTGSLTIGDAVTSIGIYAFEQSPGFSGTLTIGNSVESIGDYAFMLCSNFTGPLTIPNSVTSIGTCAFDECSHLTGSLTIPNSVISIGNWAFNKCSGLTGTLTIPNSVTSIGDGAFADCSHLTGSLTIPNSVTSIGKCAFINCSGLTGSLTIPNPVTSIGWQAFNNCSGFTGTLTIGSSVTSIDYWAFRNTQFTNIIAKPVTPPTLGNDVFGSMTGLLSITVPCFTDEEYENKTGWSDFAEIIDDGFMYVLTVTSANPDSGSASITQQATCENPRATVTAMPSDFYRFVNWTENGVQVSTDNPYTFTLTSDRNLVANFTVTDQYDFTAFCATGQKLYYSIIDEEQDRVCIVAPNGDNINGWDGFTKPTGQIELSETVSHNGTNYTVTAIGSCAFYYCNGLKGTLIIPNSVKSIGSRAFENCTGFTGSLNIPNSVEGVGDRAFAHCSGFTGSLTIPNSLESIGDYAFAYCSGFKGSLTIPNSLLGEYSFAWSGFTGSLILGSAVTNIGAENFLRTHFSQFVAEPITPPSTTAIFLNQIRELQSIFVPCGSGEAYRNSWSETASIIKEGSFQYDLNVASSNPELGTVCITQYADCQGNRSIVTATPAQNCWLSSWTENGEVVSTNNNYSFFMESDHNLVANFYRQWDFSATCTTGQLLYYRIIDAQQHWVSIVAPKSDDQYGWEGFAKPTGEIELPNTVTHNGTTYTVKAIGRWTFYHCVGLTGSLNIPDSVTDIADYAFSCCEGFNGSLTIGNAVTSIGEGAFDNCSGFNGSLTIGNSVTSIGKSAFAHCRQFTGSLIIPNSVTSIGTYAFSDCKGFTGPFTIGNSVTSIGDLAFWDCLGFTGSLTISSSVKRIGDRAFLNCGFAHIISKARYAPILDNYIPATSNKVYIPLGSMESYQYSNWGRDDYNYDLIEYGREDYHFNGSGCEWNTAANWTENEVPFMPCHNAFINANCIFDATGDNAALHSVNVAEGKTLTVAEGKTLTADLITLESGAQLINNNGTVACNDLTVKKDITGYGTGADNWYLVSSPVNETFLPVGMMTNPADDYDLYRFDQTGDSQGREWLNYKAGAFLMENQSGYLYASKNGTTIIFRGNLAATEAKTLAYNADADFPGFNLVGNPYPCNATISGTGLRSSNYFYKMNADGTDLEVVDNPIIAPCTGIFAVAANSNATVKFAKTNATANVTRGEKSSLKDIRVELLANGKVIDRAFLNMNGESLPKFSLQDKASEICFYQNKEELAVASTDATCSEMPLNFKAEKNGTYTISVNTENLDAEYLHLIDNLTGNDVDLLGDGTGKDAPWRVSTYTFDAKTSDYASRFKLVFSMTDTSAGSVSDSFAYISNGEIVISNEGRATLQVIDVLGRIVSSEEINGESRISTNGLTAGLYILNLNGRTQKIVVE